MKKLITINLVTIILACNPSSKYEANNNEYFLMEQFDQIESLISQGKKLNTEISQSPVEWHLDHMLKTVNSIYDSLKYSDAKTYESNFHFIRSVVYLTGTMPRGVAQSPQSVLPPSTILVEDILAQLQEARDKMKLVLLLDKNANFHHPKFNQLNRNEALRFIEIHTNHHLSIIEDILEP